MISKPGTPRCLPKSTHVALRRASALDAIALAVLDVLLHSCVCRVHTLLLFLTSYLAVYLSIYLSIYVSTYLSSYLSVYLLIYLCPSISRSISTYIYVYIHPWDFVFARFSPEKVRPSLYQEALTTKKQEELR